MKAIMLLILLEIFVNISECKKCTKIRWRPARYDSRGSSVVTEIYETCCKGYALVQGVCVPLCNTLCVNSICTAPEFCTCNSGYDRIDNFSCRRSCSSGDCDEISTEYEDESYTTDFLVHKTKREVSEDSTEGSIYDLVTSFPASTEDNTEAFGLSDGSTTANPDIPKLTKETESPEMTNELESTNTEDRNESCDCYNGKCGTNGQCMDCKPGYFLKDNACYSICSELCKPNGHCNVENNCKCNDGYKLVDRRCHPICPNECVNGKCVARSQCECDEGFKPYANDSSHCVRRHNNSEGFAESMNEKKELNRNSSNVGDIILYVILAILATAAIVTALYIHKRKNPGAVYNVEKWENQKRIGYTGKPEDEILIH